MNKWEFIEGLFIDKMQEDLTQTDSSRKHFWATLRRPWGITGQIILKPFRACPQRISQKASNGFGALWINYCQRMRSLFRPCFIQKIIVK